MQLAVTRDILFPVVLGIDFLQTHGGVMSFPTKQLYLTNPSPKPTESPLKNSHTQNPYTPSMHPPNTYHPHPRTSTKPNQPYHIISNEPVTIPPRANTVNHPVPFRVPEITHSNRLDRICWTTSSLHTRHNQC